VAGIHVRSIVQLEGTVGKSGKLTTGFVKSRERRPFWHFGILVSEGIGDREFRDKPYELKVHEIALTVG
jgi:hypothetical protein